MARRRAVLLIATLCFPPQVPGAAVPAAEQSSADGSLRGPLHLRHGSSVLPCECLWNSSDTTSFVFIPFSFLNPVPGPGFSATVSLSGAESAALCVSLVVM